MTGDPARVVVAGDWDGNQRWAARVINYAADHRAGFVVQCGDFGYRGNRGWTDVYLSHLDSVLARRGIELYWIDGNHENHPLLAQIPIDPETGRRPITDYISHLPRCYGWCWHGQTWLALGGAHSVDRRWGQQGRDWWPEEELSAQDAARAIQGGPADVIVAHDCPAGVAIPGLDRPSSWPAEDLAASEEHRHRIQSVVDATHPHTLFHGHFHRRYNGEYLSPDGNRTHIIGLAEDAAASLNANCVLIDLPIPAEREEN